MIAFDGRLVWSPAALLEGNGPPIDYYACSTMLGSSFSCRATATGLFSIFLDRLLSGGYAEFPEHGALAADDSAKDD